MKKCAACNRMMPLDAFHRQPKGPQGRHSYCKECYSLRYKNRKRNDHPSNRRDRNFRCRYGLTANDVESKLKAQGGVCSICGRIPAKPCLDHDHQTGAVRGVLCHSCNVRLAIVEDRDFVDRANAYLREHQ